MAGRRRRCRYVAVRCSHTGAISGAALAGCGWCAWSRPHRLCWLPVRARAGLGQGDRARTVLASALTWLLRTRPVAPGRRGCAPGGARGSSTTWRLHSDRRTSPGPHSSRSCEGSSTLERPHRRCSRQWRSGGQVGVGADEMVEVFREDRPDDLQKHLEQLSRSSRRPARRPTSRHRRSPCSQPPAEPWRSPCPAARRGDGAGTGWRPRRRR